MKKYVDKDKLQEFAAKLHTKQKSIFATKSQVGTPLVASTAAEMTDQTKIYVYVGSESGYTSGNWYYYNGTAWTSGGVYNSAAIQTDTTLSNAGMAADSKTVGDKLGNLAELETSEKTNLVAAINEAAMASGSGQPVPVTLAENMTDSEKLYVYVGNEEGYTFGDWYYYDEDSDEWVDSGQYGVGVAGHDGYSPSASVTQTETGAVINITDKNGTSSVEIENGTATDAQVAAWLDEHPEATTTVEDKSITLAKLSEDLAERLDVNLLENVTYSNQWKLSTADGKTTQSNGSYSYTKEYIEVEAGKTYYLNPATTTAPNINYKMNVLYYDSEKEFLSYKDLAATIYSFTPPENCVYVRLNLRYNVTPRYMNVRDANPFVKVGYTLPDLELTESQIGDGFINESMIGDGAITPNKTSFMQEEVINILSGLIPTASPWGSLNDGTSGTETNPCTGYIPVDPTVPYYHNCINGKVCCYDENKAYLGRSITTGYGSPYTFSNYNGAVRYIKIQINGIANIENPCITRFGSDYLSTESDVKGITFKDSTMEKMLSWQLSRKLIEPVTESVQGLIADKAKEAILPWYGKKLCMLGDSITQYPGSTLTNYMMEHCGFSSATNRGYAGSTWETSSGTSATEDNSAVGRVNQIINAMTDTVITQFDCITLAYGTNLNTMGSLSDTKDDVSTMCGAMRYCLEKLLYYGRANVTIGVIIPPQRLEGHGKKFTNRDYDFMDQRHSLIKQIAHQYSIPVLDLFHEGQIVPDDITDLGTMYYLGDGLHLGGNGTKQYCQKVARWLNTI